MLTLNFYLKNVGFFKVQFMQKFTQGFLPLSFNDVWITNAIRRADQDQVELRNKDDLNIPFARLTSTERQPLTFFPKILSSFPDVQMKFTVHVMSRSLINCKKNHILTCSPQCLFATGYFVLIAICSLLIWTDMILINQFVFIPCKHIYHLKQLKFLLQLSLHGCVSWLCGVHGLVCTYVPFPHPLFCPAVTRKSADAHVHP